MPDSRIGSGTTDGGMNRVTRAWRERYGPGVSREHHLIPREMKKPNTDFFQHLTELVGDGKAEDYIDRQIAIIPEGTHSDLHHNRAATSSGKVYNNGKGWNADFKEWANRNLDFTLNDLQNQIKTMMRNYNVPRSSRSAKRYNHN
mgnify:FL=1